MTNQPFLLRRVEIRKKNEYYIGREFTDVTELVDFRRAFVTYAKDVKVNESGEVTSFTPCEFDGKELECSGDDNDADDGQTEDDAKWVHEDHISRDVN